MHLPQHKDHRMLVLGRILMYFVFGFSDFSLILTGQEGIDEA